MRRASLLRREVRVNTEQIVGLTLMIGVIERAPFAGIRLRDHLHRAVAIISGKGPRLGIGVVLRAVVDDDHLVCRVVEVNERMDCWDDRI